MQAQAAESSATADNSAAFSRYLLNCFEAGKEDFEQQ